MATLPEHQTIVALVKTGVNVASVLLCFFCIISLYLYILHALLTICHLTGLDFKRETFSFSTRIGTSHVLREKKTLLFIKTLIHF